MAITLTAPDTGCSHCAGRGAYYRHLKLVINGMVAERTTQVLLHCSCLASELADAHATLDSNGGVLESWPWDDLDGQAIPQVEGAPEVFVPGSPFPIMVGALPSSPIKAPPLPAREPDSAPNPEKRAPKRAKKSKKSK